MGELYEFGKLTQPKTLTEDQVEILNEIAEQFVLCGFNVREPEKLSREERVAIARAKTKQKHTDMINFACVLKDVLHSEKGTEEILLAPPMSKDEALWQILEAAL